MTWTPDAMPDLSGRLAVVTGATGGLGFETACVLAAKGAEVVLAARNAEKAATAEASIRSRHPRAAVRFQALDLAALSSVQAFAERMTAEGRPIDILIDNAGVMALPRRETTIDGFEMQLGSNYLSHFALVGRLSPLLIAGGARVVQVSSVAHRGARIRLDDLNFASGYRPWSAYQQSKLAMLMFAIELQRRSDANGWGLTSVAAHPGFASTGLMSSGPGGLMRLALRWLTPLLSQSAAAGAQPILMAATAPDVAPGGYYGPQGIQEMRGPPGPARIDPVALDPDVARRLWVESERLTGVRYG